MGAVFQILHNWRGLSPHNGLKFGPAFIDEYTTRQYYLSRGSSGNVYGPVQWNDTQLAIKQTTFAAGKVTDEVSKNMEVKKNIWTSLEHKHLIRIHSVDLSELPKAMSIVMEFAAGGSLDRALRSLEPGTRLPTDVVTDWAKQIAEGLLYLHEQNVVHRDMKSSNILLMESFDIREPHKMMTLKITDFDEAKEHDHTTTMSFVGTVAYMAPEVIVKQRYSKASDVWSYGVVIWEMLSGDIPYKGLDPATVIYKLTHGKLDHLIVEQTFPQEYKRLLNRCWDLTCKKRPKFHEIFSILQRWADAPQRDPSLLDCLSSEQKISLQMEEVLVPYSRILCENEIRSDNNIIIPWTCHSDPELIKSIRVTKSIRSLVILDKELFVLTYKSSQIEVYDSIILSFSRRLNLSELLNPLGTGCCSKNKCLYIMDYKGDGRSKEFLRVDRNGTLIAKWSTGGDFGYGVSVTDESNVILTLCNKNKLKEYSPNGQLIQAINLSDAGICFPWHAIKMKNGNFVVSCGHGDELMHTVCLVDGNGTLLKSFGGRRNPDIRRLSLPAYLSVDVSGNVLVVDRLDRRVLLLDSNLEFNKEILTEEKHGLRCSLIIVLDDSSGRLLLFDSTQENDDRRILIFKL